MRTLLIACFSGMSIFLASFSCKAQNVDIETVKSFRRGTLDTALTIYSNSMDTLVHYSVYYPPGYQTSGDSYPVLYLLHGMGENHLTWRDWGMKDVIDHYVNKDSAKPMVVIMPQAFNSFYLNCGPFECLSYEDFLINEFLPYIERTYRIKTDKNNTSISGNSMGGFGTTYLSFKYNQKFGSSYSMGGALLMGYLAPVIEGKTSDELNNLPDFAMAVGVDDFVTFKSNEEFDAFLNLKNIDHSYRKRPGTHGNWIEDLPYALDLAGKHFD